MISEIYFNELFLDGSLNKTKSEKSVITIKLKGFEYKEVLIDDIYIDGYIDDEGLLSIYMKNNLNQNIFLAKIMQNDSTLELIEDNDAASILHFRYEQEAFSNMVYIYNLLMNKALLHYCSYDADFIKNSKILFSKMNEYISKGNRHINFYLFNDKKEDYIECYLYGNEDQRYIVFIYKKSSMSYIKYCFDIHEEKLVGENISTFNMNKYPIIFTEKEIKGKQDEVLKVFLKYLCEEDLFTNMNVLSNDLFKILKSEEN